jgi:hypothetical protein
VPASLKLQAEYGSDLAVLFVESQGAEADMAEAFAWRKKWMGTEAMWTTERPLEVEGNMLPKFALLDGEGKLLLSGNPLAMKKQIEEAIAAQVKQSKAAPAGTPEKLAKAWATFVKGDVTAALASVDALGTDASLREPAEALRKELLARTQTRIARARWLVDNGCVTEATSLLAALGKSVKGSGELEKAVQDELGRLAKPDPTLATEIEAAKALAAVEQKMLKDKPFEDANIKALGKVAEKHPGTKAGERAARLARLAKLEPER